MNGWTLAGAVSAFLAVAAGAFGAHGLKDRLAPDMLAVYQTGVQYQMYHALALLAVGALYRPEGSRALGLAGWLFALGTAVFSGSLYLLALSGVRAWGAITPLGGGAFLAGWLALATGAARQRRRDSSR